MRAWWPARARAAWASLAPQRKARARAIVHWMLCEFDGVVPDQRALLDLLDERDRLPRGAAVETVRALVRRGLLRRSRMGRVVSLWLPERLVVPPRGDRGRRDR